MSTLNARSSTAVTGVTAGGDDSLELFAEVSDSVRFPSRETGTVADHPRLALTIRSG